VSTREEYITGLRQLADFLAVNPGLPVPLSHWDLNVPLVGGSDVGRLNRVDQAALATGVEAVWRYGRYGTVLRFGPVEYEVFAHTDAHMADWNEQQRLGAEALARQKAETAALEPLPVDEPRHVSLHAAGLA
jgi:hypothetical protein